jgi:heavy metal sensor kinase
VIRRLPIRARLAAVSAGLAALLLAVGVSTLYLVERSEVRATLVGDARRAANQLATVVDSEPQSGDGESSSEDGAAAQGEDALATSYLRARSGQGLLLLVVGRNAPLLKNAPAARALASARLPKAGDTADVTVSGVPYLVAAYTARGRTVYAAVPQAEANAELSRLLDAVVVVTVVGVGIAALLAWLATRLALRPLQRIARRSEAVAAGDLSVRMGEPGTHDEIAAVSGALDGMLDRLEEAFAAQRRFVHDASHELRTPITIARGHLEVAAMGGRSIDPAVRDAVDLAVAELERMGRMVDVLLALARGDRDEGQIERQPVSVARLATEAVERSRSLGDRDWGLTLAPDADVHVSGDPDALEQVLLNLVANAVRHTEHGQAVAVSTRRAGDQVEIAVADEGEGIDPDALPTLFERFTRIDWARDRDRGGAGLGLAICRSIVEAHGGDVRVTSAVGRGSRFTVSLPISE